MADYAKAASDLKARLDAKTKKRIDLYAFFEELKAALRTQVEVANAELVRAGAPMVNLLRASEGEPTIELTCEKATCRISQDKEKPSVAAVIESESGEKTITFLIVTDETPLRASRVSLAPAVEPKVGTEELAATFVEELSVGAP